MFGITFLTKYAPSTNLSVPNTSIVFEKRKPKLCRWSHKKQQFNLFWIRTEDKNDVKEWGRWTRQMINEHFNQLSLVSVYFFHFGFVDIVGCGFIVTLQLTFYTMWFTTSVHKVKKISPKSSQEFRVIIQILCQILDARWWYSVIFFFFSGKLMSSQREIWTIDSFQLQINRNDTKNMIDICKWIWILLVWSFV